MAKRSTFNVTVADINTANSIIQNFISVNGFTVVEKKGEQFYKAGSSMTDVEKCFKYQINGNMLNIEAWTNAFGEHDLNYMSVNIHIKKYKDAINALIAQLNNNQNPMPYNPVNEFNNLNQPTQMQPNQNSVVTPVNNEAISVNVDNGKMVPLALALSIINLILSILGYFLGIIFLIIGMMYAVKGLKSPKKGMAIASIVLFCISFVIMLLQFVLVFLFA